MSNFTAIFDTDNASFVEGAGTEVARILRGIADAVEQETRPGYHSRVLDSNGNRVGRWAWEK